MGSRLEHVIARNVTELRSEREWTQPELAGRMRWQGFQWQSNRVAQIETLRRPVSLLEVVGLSRVFVVSASRLLAGDDEINLPSGAAISLVEVRAALEGVPVTISMAELNDLIVRGDAADDATARGDLRKVAKGLGLDERELQQLSWRMWGAPFHFEREKRLGSIEGLSKRSAQTKRGHVTRALIAEVEKYLGEGQERLDKLTELHTAEGWK